MRLAITIITLITIQAPTMPQLRVLHGLYEVVFRVAHSG